MREKEIKLTNEQIVEATYALGGVVQDGMMVQRGLADEMIPSVQLGFAISENFAAISKANIAYQEYRTKLLKQYCILDDTGELIPDAEGKAQFNSPEIETQAMQDVKDLAKVEQTLTVNVLTIGELAEGGVKNIMPKILGALNWMIVKQADPEDKPIKSPLAGHRKARRR